MFFMNTNEINKLKQTNYYNISELGQFQIDNNKNKDQNYTIQPNYKLFHGIYWNIFTHFKQSIGSISKYQTKKELIIAVKEEYQSLKESLNNEIIKFNKEIKNVGCDKFLKTIAKYKFNKTMMFLDSYLEIKTLNSILFILT